MDTRRQADSLAVSNLTVGTDCSTAVISDCQTTCLSRMALDGILSANVVPIGE